LALTVALVFGFCQSNEPSQPKRTRLERQRATETTRRLALGDSNLPLSECKSMLKKKVVNNNNNKKNKKQTGTTTELPQRVASRVYK